MRTLRRFLQRRTLAAALCTVMLGSVVIGGILVPSAIAWLQGRSGVRHDPVSLFRRAVRVHDPFLTINGRWIVRRLAPDCIKVDITRLPHKRDDRKLLRSMGWETANLHLQARNSKAIGRDLAKRPSGWLLNAACAMRDRALDDWERWRAHHSATQ